MCNSQNFFGYETRKVGGSIHEDCSMLTERDIEKQNGHGAWKHQGKCELYLHLRCR